MIMNGLRNRKACGVRWIGADKAVFLVGLCACVCAKAKQPIAPIDLRSARVEELARIVTNPTMGGEVRLQAYYAILERDPGQRDEGLMTVLRDADEHFAGMSAAALIQEGAESLKVEDVLEKRIVEWSMFQGQALAAIDAVGRPPRLLGIPRAILREFILQGRSIRPEEETSVGSLNMAAKLLSISGASEDRELFRQALHVDPSLDAFWFAMARRGSLGAAEAALAQSVMRNESFSLLAHVAAATALGEDDASAEEFAVTRVREFLEEFSRKNVYFDVMARLYLDQPVPERERDEMLRYKRDLQILQALLFLDGTSARPLTFDYLESNDVGIRMTLGLVAAKRWPDGLLHVERDSFPEGEPGEFDRLLSAVVFYHPQMRAEAIAKGSEEGIEQWLRILRKSKVSALSSIGGSVLAGW